MATLFAAAPWSRISIPAFAWMFMHLIALISLFYLLRGICSFGADRDDPDADASGTAWILLAGAVYLLYWQIRWYTWWIWWQILATVGAFLAAALVMGGELEEDDD